MRREHLRDGWWILPGEPIPTKYGPERRTVAPPRLRFPHPAQAIIAATLADDAAPTGFVFVGPRGGTRLDKAMRGLCARLGIERANAA